MVLIEGAQALLTVAKRLFDDDDVEALSPDS
jgi:hypothetical protein